MLENCLCIFIIVVSILIIVLCCLLGKKVIAFVVEIVITFGIWSKYTELKNKNKEIEKENYEYHKKEQARIDASLEKKTTEEKKAWEYSENLWKKMYNKRYEDRYIVS